ncbi:hypothetical protein NUBL21976_11590 [Klebsiella pneumoniae]|nr:hypothetical protein NUBL21976_11590 [Klebsiella pneumoniae]
MYKVEPYVCVTCCNLFAKDMLRSALADEVEELGPKVPLVSKSISFACRAERLARAGASPDRAIVRPSGEAEGMGPDADPGEKVALGKSSEVVRCDIFNTPFVNFARGDMPGGYEVTQPLRREWVDLVVQSERFSSDYVHHVSSPWHFLRAFSCTPCTV